MIAITANQAAKQFKTFARHAAEQSRYLEAFKYLQLAMLAPAIPDLKYFCDGALGGTSSLIFSLHTTKGDPSSPLHLGMLYQDNNRIQQALPSILDFARKSANGRKILFPFAHSSWFPYRWQIEQQFDFYLDPPNYPPTNDLGRSLQVSRTHDYCSVLQEDLNSVLIHCRDKYESFLAQGLHIRNLNKKRLRQDLRHLYELSTESFRSNLYYEDISFEQFYKLYRPKTKTLAADYLKFAETKDGQVVGFLFSIPDYTDIISHRNLCRSRDRMAVWAQLKRSQIRGIVHKSTAVLPTARGQGIESALIYAMTRGAQEHGARYVIGAFASIENPSTRCLGITQKRNLYRLYELD